LKLIERSINFKSMAKRDSKSPSTTSPRSSGREASDSSAKPRRKRVGRPKAEGQAEDVRARLIATSQQLFAQKGYGDVSLRDIARAANVTPAMVSYYFGDKAGLYEAVFTETLGTLLSRIKAVADEARLLRAPLEKFLQVYFRTMIEQPWLPQLLLREVATRDTPLRKVFLDRFAGQATQVMPALIGREMMAGRIRSDMDERQLLLSLLGMMVFPILVEPLLGPLLGYKLNQSFADTRIDHIQKLFFEGARPQNKPRGRGPRITQL
jgi:TetR/AcrR family transcriptional regulator